MPYLKKTITEALGIPKEIAFGLPLITLSGQEEALIENHKGIISADSCVIKIKTSCRIICISGKALFIKEISPQLICIRGSIEKLEFLV